MPQSSFQIDPRLTLLLSENYRSAEKALKELIDNAWDADATSVEITLPDPVSNQPLVVKDNGSGMTTPELQSEYLKIARDRRQRSGVKTANLGRRIKGRKGIGKFAGLMIASSMKLETWARGTYSSFELDQLQLESVEGLQDFPLNIFVQEDDQRAKGTRISLTQFHQNLRFPNGHKLKQALLAEYGRESDFSIYINNKPLGIDDLQGEYKEEVVELATGKAIFRCTVSDQKAKLRKPGILVRVDGKVIGEPQFFGLENADDVSRKLLNKCYGEIDISGCPDSDFTADWGAVIEGSRTEIDLQKVIQPILRERIKSVYGQEMNLAQARLRKKAKDRISKLPENRREYADGAIKKVLDKFNYDLPESTLESIINVLLDALERVDYQVVLEHINKARHFEVSHFAEALEEFGLMELSSVAEQATNRLKFLDFLEEICSKKETLESHVHQAIENNLWLFGVEYSLFSSNITLKKQIESFYGRKYVGDRASKRPDLFLTENLNGERLLIEFKRPSHPLSFEDYQQATAYRNDFHQNALDQQINVFIIGGSFGNNLSHQDRREPNTVLMTFSDLISAARRQYQWLLKS